MDIKLLIVLFTLSGHKGLEMSATETPKKAGTPQIIKLDKALKLVITYLAVNGEYSLSFCACQVGSELFDVGLLRIHIEGEPRKGKVTIL